jgi:hypothetical protein
MFRLYSSASIPILPTWVGMTLGLASNLLFYSLTSVSTSISSSQNVVKFITEHKDCDSVVFKNEIVEIDLENKLQILEALVVDILCKFCPEKEEQENVKTEFRDPARCVTESPHPEWLDFTEVKLQENKVMATVVERIPEPLKLAIFSTADALQQLALLLQEVRNKIDTHHQSYIQHFVSLSLNTEIYRLHKTVKILEIRTHLLLELVKIYLPREKDI